MSIRFVYRYHAFILALFVAFAVGCSGTEQVTQDAAVGDDGWITLFDGSSIDGWRMVGPGGFELQEDGSILSYGGMGLFYYEDHMFSDFVLELEWKSNADTANSGIFVRFPDAPDPWYAVNTGYEIQIDDSQEPLRQTGSIFGFSASFKNASYPIGEWNKYQIKVTGQRFEIYLNGHKVNDFFGERDKSLGAHIQEGFIGLQNHDDGSRVAFRNIRVLPLVDEAYPESLAELFAVEEERDPIRVLMLTTTHGYRHEPAIKVSKEVMKALASTTEFTFDITEDLSALNQENLEGYDLLFFANTTLRLQTEHALEGTWGVDIEAPDGVIEATLELAMEANSLTGSLANGADVYALEQGKKDREEIVFQFDTPQYGRINAQATIDGLRMSGMLNVDGSEIPFNGTHEYSKKHADSEEDYVHVIVDEEQRTAIMRFLADGKGIVGAHSALDAFYAWDEYKEMVGGGLFKSHPWTESVDIVVEETDNPATSHLGASFSIRDEIYVLDENPRWNARVLMSLDMSSVEPEEDARGYYRNDYPISWIREHGGGRVFYTKLGHFADVWTTPDFLQHLLQGMRMAAGRINADFSGRIVKETIAENVWPDDIAVDDRGNVWIAELRGKVHRYDAVTEETRLIGHLETTDPTKIEHGLYGIEVDPQFYDGSPYIYLYYAEKETIINTLSRFEYKDGQIDFASEKVLLRVPTEPQCCHQAGDIEWGPDSTLYLSTGDTGMSETRPDWKLTDKEIDAFRERHNLEEIQWSRLVDSERTAQNLQDLRGKILRINKDGSIPRDNPFYGQPGVRWEIYAYGLRNPYRFKVDPETNHVYIGVVGPDAQFDYDEYNVSTKGGENFGWPREIGRLLYNEWTPDMIPDYTPPIWEYTYATGGRSASGGPVYRHKGRGAFPEAFQDKVFVYDWARGWIKYGRLVNDKVEIENLNGDTFVLSSPRLVDVKTLDVLRGTRPISLEIGPDGAIYVAEFTGFWDAAPGSKVSRYRWISRK